MSSTRAPVAITRYAEEPAEVFDVLTDPETFPNWLIGAQRIRSIDAHWPETGSAFHHVIGLGPVRVKGLTRVVTIEPPTTLVLDAGMGWLGSATVSFTVRPSGAGSELEVAEQPSSGLARRLWWVGGAPVMRVLLLGRNEISLQRLSPSDQQTSTA